MMKLKQMVLSLALILIAASGVVMTAPQSAQAASDCDRHGMLLTLKPWYYNLTEGTPPNCKVRPFGTTLPEQQKFVWTVVLNIVEDLLQIAGYVAVAFVIYGGFMYLTSSGSPEAAAKGMKTVLHAVIGLVIAIMAIGLVNLVANAGLGLN